MRQVPMRSDILGLQGQRAMQAAFGLARILLGGSGHRQVDPAGREARIGGEQAPVMRFRRGRIALAHLQVGEIVERLAMGGRAGQQHPIGCLGADGVSGRAQTDCKIVARIVMAGIEGQRVAP